MSSKRVRPPADALIADLAREQHGVVGLRQLLSRGVARHDVKHRLAVGRLQAVYRGVYSLTPERTLKREGHWMAAVLACGPGAVLSHAAAAALWDLRRSSAGIVDVTVPVPAGRARRKGIRLHRSVTLAAEQRTIHNGIPVTTVARTLVDLGDRFDRRAVERAADQAEVLRLFDLHAIHAAVDANPGRRGAAVVRRLLATYEVGAGLTESELEDEFLRLCDRFGIRRPETQVWFGPDRVDFYWPEQRLAIETDGWRWHGGRRAWEDDQRRAIRLQRRQLRVARFSYLRIFREPEAVAEDLIALLSAAPSAAPHPAG